MKFYRDAVCWACDQVEDHIVGGKLNFPEVTFADVIVHACAGLEFFRPEDARAYFTVTEHWSAPLTLDTVRRRF